MSFDIGKMPKLGEINGKSDDFMRAIGQFLANARGFFIISGTNGNGKTFAASALFRHYWRFGCDNRFWNQCDLKMKYLEFMAQYGSCSHFLLELVQAPLLVLDDLGTVRPSEAFMEFLYIIADKRFNDSDAKATIITTNLTAQGIRDVFGDAFLSRISSGLCFRYEGADRRSNKF